MLAFETAVAAVMIPEAQISPDGTQVAYVTRPAASEANTPPASAVWLVSSDGGPARCLTRSGASDSCPRFAPDGTRLAFLSDRKARGVAQLFLLDLVRGGDAVCLTDQPGGLIGLGFSPDGATIAYTAQDAPSPEETTASERQDEVVVDEGVKLTGLWLLEVPADAGLLAAGELPAQRRLSPPGTHVVSAPESAAADFGWSPRGDCLAASTANSPKLHDTTDAELVVFPLAGEPRTLAPVVFGTGSPCFSPDGSTIAFVAGVERVPALFCLQTVPAAGGRPRVLSPDHPGSFFACSWRADGQLVALSQERQQQHLVVVDPVSDASSDALLPFDRPGAIASFSLSADGKRVAFIRSEDHTYGELFSAELGGRARQLTDQNPWTREQQFGEVRELTWTSSDGLEIEGLLVLPVGYRDGERYPTLLQIHGGPMGAYMHTLHAHAMTWSQFLAQRGYAVLMPNPRGSSGRGTEFLGGIAGCYGEPDFQDLMTGIDKLVELGIADPDQLVVGGWSGGGYLTNWTITHTDRFKAAVSGAGIANWVSFQGTADCRAVFDQYFGDVADEPENHWSHSPIRYIKRATTPTLILYGERDERVPPTQGHELHEGLKARGVETKLVLYPREGHGIVERAHQLDLLGRVVEWFDRHLGRGPTAAAAAVDGAGQEHADEAIGVPQAAG